MAELLSDERIVEALKDLPAWSGDREALRRTVHAPSFPDGIRLVDAVAEVAEALDHHPDIDIRWRDVTFTLSTHVKGGVTERDLTLARRIDEVVARG